MNIDQSLASPAKVLVAGNSAAGGALSISKAPANANTKTYITGFMFSAGAAPAAATSATLTVNGATLTVQIPASAYALVFVNFANKPLESNVNETVQLQVGAHGGAVVVSGAIFGYQLSS